MNVYAIRSKAVICLASFEGPPGIVTLAKVRAAEGWNVPQAIKFDEDLARNP